MDLSETPRAPGRSIVALRRCVRRGWAHGGTRRPDGAALSTWALTAAALCLVVYAAASKGLDRTLVTPALFFTAAGLLARAGTRDHGSDDPERACAPAGGRDADAGAVLRCLPDLARGAPGRARGAGAAARHRAPADDRRRGGGRCRRAARDHGRRGARPRHHARVHRRRARTGRGERQARSLPDPSGAERRERPQRRPLRAHLLHRAGDRRRRGVDDDQPARPRGSSGTRSGSVSSEGSSPGSSESWRFASPCGTT